MRRLRHPGIVMAVADGKWLKDVVEEARHMLPRSQTLGVEGYRLNEQARVFCSVLMPQLWF